MIKTSVDPRVSLLILGSFFLFILASSNPLIQTGFIILFVFSYFYKTSLRQVIRIWFLILIPTIVILILNFIFVSKEITHLSLMVLRFWGLTWLFNWFLRQVSPDDLAKALWALNIPYNLAWQISLSYRFIPLFQEESQRIYDLQISRGIPLDGSFFLKIKYLPSMSIPLLIMTQDKANLFSEALFARNWNSNSPKTVLDPLKMQIYDWIVIGVIFCLIIMIILFR